MWVHTASQGRADTGGDVTVVTTAPIVARTTPAIAARPEMPGPDGIDAETGRGTVTVEVERYEVSTTAAAATGAAGVRAAVPLGRGRLLLTVRGEGAVRGETAVRFEGGSDDATNPNRILVAAGGRVSGALALGSGADLVDSAGRLELRGDSDFGAGTDELRIRRGGSVSPGGVGAIQAVRIAGLERARFEPGSRLILEVDGIAARADRLDLAPTTPGGSQPALTFEGLVELRESAGRGSFRRGEQRSVVLSAPSGLPPAAQIELLPPAASPRRAIRRSYRLERDDRELLLVSTTAGSFVPPAPGGGNPRAVGAALDRLANAVAPSALPSSFVALLSGLGELELGGAYEAAANRLHAEPYDALLQGSWHAERALVEALWEGCPPPPRPAPGCAFGGLYGRSLDRVRGPDHSGFEESAVGPRGGLSRRLGELLGRGWELRVGAAYEDLSLEWRGGARGDGERALGGVALHSRGEGSPAGVSLAGLDAGLALAGGAAWFETERTLDLLGIGEAEAEPELYFVGGHGRLVQRLGAGQRGPGWYAELALAGSAVALWLDAFAEDARSAGPLRLRVAEARELVTSVRPQLALGGTWQYGALRLAPVARLGLNYAVGGADTAFRARFADAPAGGAFTARGHSEALLIEAGGALDLSLGGRVSLELGYSGRVSPDGTARFHEGQLRAEWRF